jgi:hypothetical protein
MTNESPRGHFQALLSAWLEYVRDEKEGESIYLPKSKRCYCHKSQTSYPHWPPTTHEEAVAQLRCLMGQSYAHRMYLTECWIISLRHKLTAAEPESKADAERIISLVQKNCPNATTDSNEPQAANMRRRPKKICDKVCNPVLLEGRCYCLCSCGWHREECPVHRMT